MRNSIAIALSLALLPSCLVSRTTNNESITAEHVAQLKPGVSTATDVVKTLGAPSDVVQLGRRSAYRYDHTVTKRAGLFLLVIAFMNDDTHADRVWVFFDEHDVLTHVGSTLRADGAEYKMPWSG